METHGGSSNLYHGIGTKGQRYPGRTSGDRVCTSRHTSARFHQRRWQCYHVDHCGKRATTGGMSFAAGPKCIKTFCFAPVGHQMRAAGTSGQHDAQSGASHWSRQVQRAYYSLRAKSLRRLFETLARGGLQMGGLEACLATWCRG